MSPLKRSAVIIGILVLLDQALKTAVIMTIPLHGSAVAGLLTYVRNTGITFGFLPGANSAMIAVSLVAIAAIAYALRKTRMPDRAGLVLLIAGVTGNLIDRVVHGAVIDYVRIGTFPVFNLADSMIVTGICWLLLMEIPAVRKKLQNSSNSSRSSR